MELRNINLNFELETLTEEPTVDATDIGTALTLLNALKATHNSNVNTHNDNIRTLNEFFDNLRRA